MTVLGPKIRFLEDTWIVLTGADLAPTLDGKPIPTWQRVRVGRGSELAFQGARDGMRSYLAVQGGIDVPRLMGSRSTYTKGAIGGLDGRPLRAGDALDRMDAGANEDFREVELPPEFSVPAYGHEHRIRVVLGPQNEAFTEGGVETLLRSEYKVSVQSDRMGYRLDGPAIEHTSGPDIVSDGTALGAVQVPGNGQPIILLADRGTTGGYAKIATVISVDIGKLAQALPGDSVTFRAVSVEDSHAILREQETALRKLAQAAGVGPPQGLAIMVNGEAFEVTDEDGEVIALPNETSGDGAAWSHRATAKVGGVTHEFDIQVRQVR